jgi:cystathionine beta-lyase/cystathionine gamma-synthase
VREKEIPQASGGHMRIIIGYNTATNEILYSDSWGRGHEEKRMSSDDAWIMTNGLSNLQPVS